MYLNFLLCYARVRDSEAGGGAVCCVHPIPGVWFESPAQANQALHSLGTRLFEQSKLFQIGMAFGRLNYSLHTDLNQNNFFQEKLDITFFEFFSSPVPIGVIILYFFEKKNCFNFVLKSNNAAMKWCIKRLERSMHSKSSSGCLFCC